MDCEEIGVYIVGCQFMPMEKSGRATGWNLLHH